MTPQRAVRLSLKKPTHAVCVVGVEMPVDVYRKTWCWGSGGSGAIPLVNCDRDSHGSREDLHASQLSSLEDLQDMSLMVLSCSGPDQLFESHKLVLKVSLSDSRRLRVYCARGGTSLSNYKQVLGPHHPSYEVERHRGEKDIRFHVEGLAFPDADFSGLVSLSISLVDPRPLSEVLLFTDSVAFRVAPWIMTPNTQPPLELYVCSVTDAHGRNDKFLEDMAHLALKANCKLVVCPEAENRNDRWIQGPDFRYVTREIQYAGASGLDSFGNLDVSPPVTVGDTEYPLGRILIGGSFPSLFPFVGFGVEPECAPTLRPSWPLGFRLLLASPSACLQLFQEKKEEGYGEAAQFDGLKHKMKRSINEFLADRHLRRDSLHVQKCIDWNREVLKRELGLVEGDIIDIPQLFFLKGAYAEAFFPDMVNMVVLGKYLGIPKPFGPLINGRCCLEEKVRSLLEPLGLHYIFIDDFLSYHQLLGEIHCGTNVCRKPFAFKWWNMVP
ncbi:protein-arginine deiminase type-1-like [Nannospalax galili]|uniref:protein-arginine deiminase type-1-like n=1 Tax=Nannospalax galili TaxID=1026970 RepID=UPI000819AAB9|nr:protein-arginine deiminase type-1-like [Nannospalax galili]